MRKKLIAAFICSMLLVSGLTACNPKEAVSKAEDTVSNALSNAGENISETISKADDFAQSTISKLESAIEDESYVANEDGTVTESPSSTAP